MRCISLHKQYTLFDEPVKQNEIKSFRWILLSEQLEFIEFLVGVGLKALIDDDKLSWCASVVRKYKCSMNPDTCSIHTKYDLCGKRGLCPRCSMAYARKQSTNMYEWIKENLANNLEFDLKMNQITLTLPEFLHELDKKIFAKMIRAFMKEMGLEAYGYTIQTRHSADPLSKKYHHAHCLTLNMKEVGGKLVQNDYFFDLDLMRKIWKGVIERFTDSSISGTVDLHNEYASVVNNPKKVLHMLAYCYRYPVMDLFDVQIRKKSIDYVQLRQFEKSDDPNHILQIDLAKQIMKLLSEHKPSLVWCGWLTSAKRKELTSLIIKRRS